MKNVVKNLNNFFYLLGDKKYFLPILVLFFLFSSTLDLIGLGLIGPYISLLVSPDNIISEKLLNILPKQLQNMEKDNFVFFISGLLIIVFFAKFIANILIQRTILKFSFGIQVKIVTELMGIYQKMPYLDFIENNSSKYLQTLLNYTGAYGQTLTAVLRITSESIILLVILSFLLISIGPALVFLILFYGILFFTWHNFSSPRQKEYGEYQNKATEKIIQGLNESLNGYKDIKIMGNYNFFKFKVINAIKKATLNQRRSQILQLIPSFLMDFILVLSIVTVVVIILLSKNDLQNMAGLLGIFSVAALRLKPSITIIVSSLSAIMVSRFALKNLYKDYSYLKSQNDNISQKNISNIIQDFERISFSNVSFTYPSSKRTNLNHINFEIKKGESIGIIGPSGSGKSTLIDIIVGVLSPTQGRIYINDIELNDNNLEEWQKQIAYLPQETFLIDSTIKNNITLKNEEEIIDNSKLISSIKKSKLFDFIQELPNRIDTIIGDRGVKLSGGQKQRISLARAFYHGRKILVLDEATSALDNETEEEIVSEIKELKGNYTMIIIAHRYKTVENCDRIYVLENGVIKKSGKPKTILN